MLTNDKTIAVIDTETNYDDEVISIGTVIADPKEFRLLDRQYNHSIPDSMPCCRTGRLQGGCGAESIYRMLSGQRCYCEVHNALADAEDELTIMRLLEQDITVYEKARIRG